MFKAQIAAYALMSNHYHLLLRTPEANINRSIGHIGGVYTGSTASFFAAGARPL